MAAASTIIGRCNTCCDARLRTEILTGKRLGEKTVEGFLGFDDGSSDLSGGVITDDWSMWGRVFDRVETSGSATALSNACSDCGTSNPAEGMSQRSLEDFGALSTADFSVRESRCFGSGACVCTDSLAPVEHGENLPYINPSSSTPWSVTDTTTGESLVATWDACQNIATRQVGSFSGVLVDEIVPTQDMGEVPTATGPYACSQTEVSSMNKGGGSFMARWPRRPSEDDNELARGSATYSARQIARRRYTLTGTPLQTYDVTVIFEETRLSSPATYADVEADYTVTTDVDGVAEWEDDIPLPPGDRRRCLKGYTIV